jgi:hypothetical protein
MILSFRLRSNAEQPTMPTDAADANPTATTPWLRFLARRTIIAVDTMILLLVLSKMLKMFGLGLNIFEFVLNKLQTMWLRILEEFQIRFAEKVFEITRIDYGT